MKTTTVNGYVIDDAVIEFINDGDNIKITLIHAGGRPNFLQQFRDETLTFTQICLGHRIHAQLLPVGISHLNGGEVHLECLCEPVIKLGQKVGVHYYIESLD